jgi:hypothetical protein
MKYEEAMFKEAPHTSSEDLLDLSLCPRDLHLDVYLSEWLLSFRSARDRSGREWFLIMSLG